MSAADPIVGLLQRLVRHPSVSGDERAAVDEWAAFAEEAGFSPVVQGRNSWFERRTNDGPALLLNSHLDTVKASASWTRDPWDGAIEGDQLHGLGANDAKGCVAAQIGAARALVEAGFEGNLVVCASCDEETGGEGMEKIAPPIPSTPPGSTPPADADIDSGPILRLPAYDAAIIGEPNDFAVACGQRGLVKGHIHVSGQRAHASRPWQGHNAIHAAARVIIGIERDDLNVPDDLTRATAQVTLASGGLQSNVVPDHCRLTVDSRTTPHFDNEAMIAHLEAAAATQGARLELVSSRFRPVHTPDDSSIVQAALEVTGTDTPTVFPSVCDLFWVSHVPAVVMGPGRPERSHQADEFVRITEVLAGVRTYAAIARRWWELRREGS